MAEESINKHETRKYAVVTGGNKGIGYEICRQLMKNGVMVVLTSRDEKRGKEAVENLMRDGSLDQNLVVFHQLDVVDPATVSSLVDFIKSEYGKLDILVNNAGINGLMIEGDVSILPELIERDAARALGITTEEDEAPIKSNGKLIETSEWAEECVTTNYYGAKRMIEAFIPLLLLSPLPRIVNVSSLLGKLKANSASGIAVSDECKLKFLELKAKRNHRYIVFKIEESVQQVVVEKVGGQAETHEDFANSLPPNECRYAVFDYDWTTNENVQKSRIFFVAWSPETARVRSKMLYASSKDRFRRELDGVQVELQATDPSEMSLDTFIGRVTH